MVKLLKNKKIKQTCYQYTNPSNIIGNKYMKDFTKSFIYINLKKISKRQDILMKLFAISDIHSHLNSFSAVTKIMKDSDIIVISGDLTRKGSRVEAIRVLNCIEPYNRNILAVHGNKDKFGVITLLEEKGYNIHNEGRIINDIGFFGVGGSSPTPMNTPTEYSEEVIMEFLQKGYASIKDARKTILISHTPPRGIRDKTFLLLRGGSKSIKKFLIKNSIDLCLSGHIHEASGIEYHNIGIVANPGSFSRGKYLSVEINTHINIHHGKIKKNKK